MVHGSKEWLDCLLRLQKCAARIILNAQYTTPSQVQFKALKWMTRILLHQAVLIFKGLNGLTTNHLFRQFTYTATVY